VRSNAFLQHLCVSAWLADLEVEYKEEKETLLEEIQVLRMKKLELQVTRDRMKTDVEELNKQVSLLRKERDTMEADWEKARKDVEEMRCFALVPRLL